METKRNIFLLFLMIVLCTGTERKAFKLKQVLILSRHNLRTSLGENLANYTQKEWPKRDGDPGLLTQKGVLLEEYMGEYFSEWLKSEEFLSEECPGENVVHVYANSLNRTVATAEAFVNSAFPNCNVSVYHNQYTNKEDMDPNFNPVIHNTTDAYKTRVINEVNRKIKQNYKLKAGLLELNNILDIKNSEICKLESICDLTDMSKNSIHYEVGQQFWVYGPLFIGISVLDSFIMTFYEGLPLDKVAWGLLTPEKWKIISEVGRQDHYIRYTTIAKDIAAPLRKIFVQTFLNYDIMPKFILTVGHDFNQNSILKSMGFKPIRLPNQYETYPIGGKVVFQRWTDNKDDYLKIEYIYAAWAQLRNASRLSLADPPQRVLLQLNWCKVDENGFCPWNEFINKLPYLRD